MSRKNKTPKVNDYPRKLRDDVRHTMASKQGRRLMYALVFERFPGFGCGLLHPSYSGHANDTAFNEGRRDIGLQLQTLLRVVTPNEYTAMMVERLQDDMERRGETSSEETTDE